MIKHSSPNLALHGLKWAQFSTQRSSVPSQGNRGWTPTSLAWIIATMNNHLFPAPVGKMNTCQSLLEQSLHFLLAKKAAENGQIARCILWRGWRSSNRLASFRLRCRFPPAYIPFPTSTFLVSLLFFLCFYFPAFLPFILCILLTFVLFLSSPACSSYLLCVVSSARSHTAQLYAAGKPLHCKAMHCTRCFALAQRVITQHNFHTPEFCYIFTVPRSKILHNLCGCKLAHKNLAAFALLSTEQNKFLRFLHVEGWEAKKTKSCGLPTTRHKYELITSAHQYHVLVGIRQSATADGDESRLVTRVINNSIRKRSFAS